MTRVCNELGRSVDLAVCFQQEKNLNPNNPIGKGRFILLSQLKDAGCPAKDCGSGKRLGLCCGCSFCHTESTLYFLLIESSSFCFC